METHHSNQSYFDLIVIWVGTVLGQFQLSDAVLWVTLIYTLFRLYVLIRDEIFNRKSP
jgi:hypothetical protein